MCNTKGIIVDVGSIIISSKQLSKCHQILYWKIVCRNAHDFPIVQKSFVDKGVVGGGKFVNPMCIQTRGYSIRVLPNSV